MIEDHVEIEEEAVEEDSLTAELSAAWDAAEAEETTEVEETPDEPISEAKEEVAQAEESASPDTTEDSLAELPAEGEPEADTESPPVSLSPAAREAWKDTPDVLKKEFAKRERDFNTGLQKNAENANRATQMDEVLRPFDALFQVDGGRPGDTIKGLLQTATGLQMGSPQQKVNIVANLIKQFGIDIEGLDNTLSGQGMTQAAPQQQGITPEQIQQMVDQRFQQQNQNVQGQQAQTEIQQFASDPTNEFYNDVRGDMADILDVSARQGRTLSLKQAYDKACLMRDDISAIIRSRQAAPTPAQRKASKSITGLSSGGKAPTQANTLRDSLEMAWDAADLG